MYTIVKHTHLTIILLTFVFFIINFVLMMRKSPAAQNKVLKIGPHILYTLFVITFIYMISVNPLKLYPFVNGWASSKLGGFVLYVLSITLALKWAKTNLWRFVGLISAIFWLVMSARLAYAHHLKVKGAEQDTSAYLEQAQIFLTSLS
ncbi:SirB2 family protein [Glaciecola sp. MH2013]|uniref:SirB2 family protein n=1 Tax=Glaciecola sp. MH2013 TaxID=2785524 RepID=UPI00189D0E62|nr:SirB2 family protein [Glaciecola sp. MH2013]MBF7073931.1 SirB2 family protein [Glaciecola sp. MH2013]